MNNDLPQYDSLKFKLRQAVHDLKETQNIARLGLAISQEELSVETKPEQTVIWQPLFLFLFAIGLVGGFAYILTRLA